MTLHAQNILPGDIPYEWLQEQDSFICLQCHQIVANSRFGSHSEKCSGSIRGPRSSGYASDHARKTNSKPSKEKAKSKVQYAVYKAREGVLGKACKVLTTSGIAPNTPGDLALVTAKASQGSSSIMSGSYITIRRFQVASRIGDLAPLHLTLCLKAALFDAEVRRHFCDRVAIDPSDSEWLQVQLSLSRGGLSLRRPADILVPNWMIGKPAAFDLTVVSQLNSTTLNEAGARSGSAAGKAEVRKHNANDAKCTELGWVFIPLVVETYGCWGVEAQGSISRLAARLALQLQCSKSKAITSIYQRLNLTLVHCNARALLPVLGFSIQWARAENVVS
eukprot:Em0004g1608a